jgi:putative glutamine amidotransferase
MFRVALPFGSRTPESKRGGYRDALRAVGIQPVEDVTTLDGLDGLMLAGGSDVDPALYGAERQAESGPPDRDRDDREIKLVREALDLDLPVFAICRGLQMLNVALGGTLIQHIEGHRQPKEAVLHAVKIDPASRLESILKLDDYVVNSRHHQCADRVASGLVVTARDPGGVVEALELPGKRFVLAVQWHPEERTGETDLKLFEAFRDAIASRPKS